MAVGIVPLWADTEQKGIPTSTLKFILACGLVHVATFLIGKISPGHLHEWFNAAGFWWYFPVSALSCIFIHVNFPHLLFNMLFFLVFASPIELAEGKRKFWLLVMFGALVSSYFQAFMLWIFGLWLHPGMGNWQLDIPSVGASGMVSAFIAAYLIRFWRNRVYVVMNIGLVPIPKLVRMPAWIVVLGFQVLFNLYYGIYCQGYLGEGGVGYLAHLGGFIAGFSFAYYSGFQKHQKRDYFVQQAEDLAKAPLSGSYAAAKTYGQALGYDPGNGRILLEMARCSYSAGDDRASLEYYCKAVRALLKSNQDEQLTVEAYGEAFNRFGLVDVSDRQMELVRLLLKYGDWQTAQKALESFCETLVKKTSNLGLYIRAKLALAYILDHNAGRQRQAREIVGMMLGDFPGNPMLKYASQRLEHSGEQVRLFNFNPGLPGYPFSVPRSVKVHKPVWRHLPPGLVWKFGLGILLTPVALLIVLWMCNILGTALRGIFKFSVFA